MFDCLKPLKLKPPTQLPTNLEVGKAIAFERAKEMMIREQFSKQQGGFKMKTNEVFKKIADEI